MRSKRGECVRVVVRLPIYVLEELKRQELPLSIYVRHRLSLVLFNLNVLMGLLSACARLGSCEVAKERKSVGIYLHEKEYKMLKWHVDNINEYLRKYDMPTVSLNRMLGLILTDACHERKAS